MKTNAYLVEYAKAQVGKPYWFGTFGQTASKKLYEEKKKQYPKQYTAKDFPSQYGQRVHDCVGLHNGALWSETPTSAPKYNAKQDLGADGLYKKATKKGKIEAFKPAEGLLVFKGTDKKKTHVGIYSDGYVYEAKGHAYGVKKTKFNKSSWGYWAQSPFFTAEATEKPSNAPADSKPSNSSTPAEKPTQSNSEPITGKVVKASKKPAEKRANYARTFKVTATHGLNMRDGAGKGNKIMVVVPLNKEVSCDGSLTRYAGEEWLYVSYKKGETTYFGYCCKNYLS